MHEYKFSKNNGLKSSTLHYEPEMFFHSSNRGCGIKKILEKLLEKV
jgi:hypothetical protein